MSSHSKTFREGDFIENRDKLIFDVKGMLHPPDRVIAFLRYYPSSIGGRERGGIRYEKVYSLVERFSILKSKAPSYVYFDKVLGSVMQGVPVGDVQRLYQPIEKLMEMSAARGNLDPVQRQSLDFCELLSKSAGIALNKLGVTGSILVGLHGKDSDIDVIVYGTRSCSSVYRAIGSLYSDSESQVRAYTKDELEKLFRFRASDTYTEWESFLRTESRRRLQGIFRGRDYFLRFIKDWGEVPGHYGDAVYSSLGKATIRAKVIDDTESLFTPCSYKVRDTRFVSEENHNQAPIGEICSFRGRFCEIARREEYVTGRGKLELVSYKSGDSHTRLVVGEDKEDFLTLL
ncbi:MAG: nucleotidyltransferase domain-containing protein [Promethearchaeati archaeon SRVP18_Atabeyarchaeia-1]